MRKDLPDDVDALTERVRRAEAVVASSRPQQDEEYFIRKAARSIALPPESEPEAVLAHWEKQYKGKDVASALPEFYEHRLRDIVERRMRVAVAYRIINEAHGRLLS